MYDDAGTLRLLKAQLALAERLFVERCTQPEREAFERARDLDASSRKRRAASDKLQAAKSGAVGFWRDAMAKVKP